MWYNIKSDVQRVPRYISILQCFSIRGNDDKYLYVYRWLFFFFSLCISSYTRFIQTTTFILANDDINAHAIIEHISPTRAHGLAWINIVSVVVRAICNFFAINKITIKWKRKKKKQTVERC